MVVLQQRDGVTAGLAGPVGETRAALGVCDPLVVDLRSGPTRGRTTNAIPPRVRHAVLARDAHRCVNPRCSARLWLDLHHVTFRSQGGEHVEENLVTLCSCCHEALHDGNLAVRHADEPGVVEIGYLDGASVRVRLGEGPVEWSGPRGPRAAPPSPQRLLLFGTRGLGSAA